MPVEGEKQRAVQARLSRVAGQVRGIQKMVDGGAYCVDVLTQIAAAQEALRSVGRIVLRDHLEHCVTTAIVGGDQEVAARQFDELTELFYRYVR